MTASILDLALLKAGSTLGALTESDLPPRPLYHPTLTGSTSLAHAMPESRDPSVSASARSLEWRSTTEVSLEALGSSVTLILVLA